MINPSRLSLLGVIALLGCASRTAPTVHAGAASLDAQPAPAAVVTRALDGDPPAPGTDDTGWAGLHPASGASPTHEHAHMGHGGHGDHAQHREAAPAQPQPASGHAQHEHAGHGDPESGAHSGHGAHAGHPHPRAVEPGEAGDAAVRPADEHDHGAH